MILYCSKVFILLIYHLTRGSPEHVSITKSYLSIWTHFIKTFIKTRITATWLGHIHTRSHDSHMIVYHTFLFGHILSRHLLILGSQLHAWDTFTQQVHSKGSSDPHMLHLQQFWHNWCLYNKQIIFKLSKAKWQHVNSKQWCKI